MDHPAPDIRELAIDGIRTLHMPRPGATRATLWFGVGWADETYLTRGVTHLVEHLVMSSLDRVTYERNAQVSPHRTAFWAAGRPEEVGSTLTQVAAGLRALPMARVDREVGVLKAEYAQRAAGPAEALMALRYGNTGLGLAAHPTLGPRAPDPEAVRSHAERWFVRQNAVLTVSGELPENLSIEVPDHPRPVRPVVSDLVTRPCWTWYGGSAVGLSMVLDDTRWAPRALAVIASRLERSLREERGIIYGVDGGIWRFDGTGKVLGQMIASVAPGSTPEVATAVAVTLLDCLEKGITPDEAAEAERSHASLRESNEFVDWCLGHGADLVLATGSIDRLTPRFGPAEEASREVQAALAAAIGTAFMMGPREWLAPLPFRAEPGWATIPGLTTPRLSRRLRSSAPKGTIMGFDGIAVQGQEPSGEFLEVRLDECVGVGVAGDGRYLISRRGAQVWVDPKQFRGADRIVREVDARLPAELRFSME